MAAPSRKRATRRAHSAVGARAQDAGDRPGRPLELDITLIDEDPLQPRHADSPGFEHSSLAELAATIRQRGVKTPISVRDNPQAPGRFVINHGARRCRASRLAGKATIPAFIDNDYSDVDQVIENLQRNELTAREISDYIGRELAKGVKKGDIAKSIGKSAAFVTQHAALLDLPAPIARVFNSGRVRDVTVVNELVTCFKLHREDVARWLEDESVDITRGAVKLLRDFIEDKAARGAFTEADGDAIVGYGVPGDLPAAPRERSEPTPDRLRSPVVRVLFEGRTGCLLLHRRPGSEGHAWIRFDGGAEVEVDLGHVRLLALTEREA